MNGAPVISHASAALAKVCFANTSFYQHTLFCVCVVFTLTSGYIPLLNASSAVCSRDAK